MGIGVATAEPTHDRVDGLVLGTPLHNQSPASDQRCTPHPAERVGHLSEEHPARAAGPREARAKEGQAFFRWWCARARWARVHGMILQRERKGEEHHASRWVIIPLPSWVRKNRCCRRPGPSSLVQEDRTFLSSIGRCSRRCGGARDALAHRAPRAVALPSAC